MNANRQKGTVGPRRQWRREKGLEKSRGRKSRLGRQKRTWRVTNEGDSEENLVAGNRKRIKMNKRRTKKNEKEKLLFLLLLLWLLAA